MIALTQIALTTMTSKIEHKFDKQLKKKYDLCIKRIQNKHDKKDALVLFEGDEGEGKTNHSVCFADYVSQQTGRMFDNSCVRFQAEQMIEEAKKTKDKIFIWDEPALQGLKKQWWNKVQINLTQLLMMARKNRHLFIFNLTDYTEFNKYIIRRAVFMIRIYTRGEKNKTRRFMYFPRKKLRLMWEVFQTKRKRQYTKFHSLHGSMAEGYLLPEIIDEAIYEKDKDDAIRSIGEEQNKDRWEKKLIDLYGKLANIEYPLNNSADLNRALGEHTNFMTRVKQKAKKEGLYKEEKEENYELMPLITNKG